MMKENKIAQEFATDKDEIFHNKGQYFENMKSFWSQTANTSNKTLELSKIVQFINTKVLIGENYQIDEL